MSKIQKVYDYSLTYEKAKESYLWPLYKKDVALMENRAGYEPDDATLKSHFSDFNFLHIVAEWGKAGESGIEVDVWARHHDTECIHLVVISRQGEKIREQEFFGEIAEKQMRTIMDNIIVPFHPQWIFLFKK